MSIYNYCTVSELQYFVRAAINIVNIEGVKIVHVRMLTIDQNVDFSKTWS